MAESDLIRVRRRKRLAEALDLADEKWPNLGDTELVQRIAEQWLNQQDKGNSKTQKIIDIDEKITGIEESIEQMMSVNSGIAAQVSRLAEILDKIYPIVTMLKSWLEQHGFEE